MQINKAEFKCSSERISQVPKDALKDIAFIDVIVEVFGFLSPGPYHSAQSLYRKQLK